MGLAARGRVQQIGSKRSLQGHREGSLGCLSPDANRDKGLKRLRPDSLGQRVWGGRLGVWGRERVRGKEAA